MRQKKRGPKVKLRKEECKICLKIFKPKRKTQIFCCLECRKEGYKYNVGRPRFNGDLALKLMRDFLFMGYSITQSAKMAGLNPKVVNEYSKLDDDFNNKIWGISKKYNLLARRWIMNKIEKGDATCCRWWLENTDPQFMKTKPNKLGPKLNIDWGCKKTD